MNKKQLAIILKIVISVALIVLLIKVTNLDLRKTLDAIKETNIKWFIATTVMFMATTFTNSYRWWILARLLNYDFSLFKAIRMYFEAMFANNFLPSNFGGDAIRAYDLGRKDKSWLRAASTIVAERFFGFTVMFCLIPFGLIIMEFSQIRGALSQEIKAALLFTFAAMFIGFATYGLWSKIPFGIVQKFNYAVQEYTKCKTSLRKVIIWTLITHMFLLAGNVCSAYALGVPIHEIPVWYWLLMTPAATLASFVIPAVKGVGAKEASYVYLLGFLGISADKGLAIGFIAFVATLIASLPGVTIAFSKKFSMAKNPESINHPEVLTP